MKVNKVNLMSFLVFMISPLLGLIFAFCNIRNLSNRVFFYFICSAFFGVLFLKNPPIHDLYRYYDRFKNIADWSDVGLYTQDYFFDVVSIVFNYLDLPFYIVPSFFVFLTLIVSFFAVEFLIKEYKITQKKQLFMIVSLVILSNPFMISLGLRSFLAFSFLFYGVVLYSHDNFKRSFLFFILSVFTHASFIVFLLPLILIKIFPPKKILIIIVSIFIFLTSKTLIEYLIQLKIVSIFFGDLLAYGEFDNLGDKSERGLVFYYMYLSAKLFFIYYFYSIISVKYLNKNQNCFYNYVGYLILICSICSVSEVALGRYTTYTAILLFFLYVTCNLKEGRMFIFNRSILVLFLIFNFLILNLYTNRNFFFLGKPVEMSLISPIHVFLYTKDEYDHYLSNIDYDGYPKENLD